MRKENGEEFNINGVKGLKNASHPTLIHIYSICNAKSKISFVKIKCFFQQLLCNFLLGTVFVQRAKFCQINKIASGINKPGCSVLLKA